MRIAMAAPLYLPDFRGGAIQVCRSLSGSLREAGNSVAILAGCATPDVPVGATERAILDGFPIWRTNLGDALDAFSPSGFRNPEAQAGFADFLEQVRPDLLHIHGLQGLGVGLLHAASLARVPVVVTLHDWWWFCPCLFGLSPSDQVCRMPLRPEQCSGREGYDFAARREALSAVMPLVARFLVPSEFLFRSLTDQGFPKDRLLVSPNGTARPDPQALEKESLPGILRIGYFGGAGNREKGIADLAAAIGQLPLGRFQFLLYGVPRSEMELHRSDVVHPPPFEPDDLDTVFAGIDVLVVPSRMRESFSLVTREAMVRGVPVVATASGGPQEVVVDGQNGFSIPVGDAGALAQVLLRLADDRPLEAALAEGARRTAAQFPSPRDQMLQTMTVYREVIAANSRIRYGAPAARGPKGSPALDRPSLAGKRILFLSGCDGAPLRYRVHHVAESLSIIGISSKVLHYAAIEVEAELRHTDVLVLFRTPLDAALQRVFRTARKYQLPIVFSADDLIFHPERFKDAPALLHEDASIVRGFRESAQACAQAARRCDAVIGSSPELVAAAEDLGLPGFLLRNSTSALLERISRSCTPRAGGSRQMGYFSGTDTHDLDLASIAPALAGAMARVPDLGLTIGGPVALPEALRALAHRIERLPLMGWSDLPAALSRMQLNLAPLQPSGRFNAAKSDVKFLEAALVGVPSVVSPAPEFLWGTGGGQLARLAETSAAWEEAVVDLVHNEPRGQGLGAAAQAMVLQSREPAAMAAAWEDALREILVRIPRSAAGSASLPPEPVSGQEFDFALVDLEPAGLLTDAACLEATFGEPLSDEAPLVQEIVCRRESARRIDFRFGNYGRVNQHRIHVQVTDQGGSCLGRRSLEAASLVDCAFVGVDLQGPARGGQLRVEIRSEGARPGNEVLVWRAPDPGACLQVGDNRKSGESVSFRVFSEMDS